MPKRNFVREIKAENIKDINPDDIIYLALKDGSILLVAEKDEETREYEDYLESSSQKKANAYFFNKIYNNNKKLINANTISSNKNTIDTDNNINNINNNNITTKYSYYSKDRIKTPSYSINNDLKRPFLLTSLLNKNEYQNKTYVNFKNEEETMNKTYNFGRTNYISELNKTQPNLSSYLRREKLEKSFDNINNNQKVNNNYVHTIEHLNSVNNSFQTFKTDIRINKRPVSTKPHQHESIYRNNIININNIERHYTNSRTPTRREKKLLINDLNKTNYSNNLVNMSDLNINTEDNSFMNRTLQVENKDTSKKYFDLTYGPNYYKAINSFKSSIPKRSQSSTTRIAQTPKNQNKTYTVQRKEMQIMGRIINDDNLYRLIDHNHPNVLFEPKCPYCQHLARNNKLSLSNITEESIFDNHSFHAIFGNSSKKGKSLSKTGSNLYKII